MDRAALYESQRIDAERENNRRRSRAIENEIYASATRDLLPRNTTTPERTPDDPAEPIGIHTPPVTFTDDELRNF